MMLRRRRRHLWYTLLNLTGLTLGAAVCLVVGLFAYDELSADRFHENHQRIVQVGFEMSDRSTLAGPYPLAQSLATEVPGVLHAAAMNLRPEVPAQPDREDVEAALDVLHADPSFFDIFSYDILAGDPRSTVAAPDGLVLTESAAHSLSGRRTRLGRSCD